MLTGPALPSFPTLSLQGNLLLPFPFPFPKPYGGSRKKRDSVLAFSHISLRGPPKKGEEERERERMYARVANCVECKKEKKFRIDPNLSSCILSAWRQRIQSLTCDGVRFPPPTRKREGGGEELHLSVALNKFPVYVCWEFTVAAGEISGFLSLFSPSFLHKLFLRGKRREVLRKTS